MVTIGSYLAEVKNEGNSLNHIIEMHRRVVRKG